ncbi:MAG: DUF2752 domain-containing protein [Oscillospiraceae bacterium]|nr:DUF2752 domain-containing protein [Oscillospiraceae bacterium]
MPAIFVGICLWASLWVFTGTSCWVRSIFGIPCPGCGSSRAVAEIFRGNIREALRFHPLVFLSLAVIFVFGFSIFDKNDKSKSRKKIVDLALLCFAVLYIGVYIVRMVMFFPGTEPMTYLHTSILGRLIGFIENLG